MTWLLGCKCRAEDDRGTSEEHSAIQGRDRRRLARRSGNLQAEDLIYHSEKHKPMTSTVKIQDATGPDREGSTRGRNFAAFARSFAARLRQRFSLEASSLAWVTMTERAGPRVHWLRRSTDSWQANTCIHTMECPHWGPPPRPAPPQARPHWKGHAPVRKVGPPSFR